jgi:hypothetical protein
MNGKNANDVWEGEKMLEFRKWEEGNAHDSS